MLGAARAAFGDALTSFLGGNRTLLRLAFFGGVSELVWRKVVSVEVGSGPSMQPTLNGDAAGRIDVMLVDHVAAMSGNLRPGDLVVLRSPQGKRACKRVVGVADDIVLARVADGKGEARQKRIRVPKGHAWVEGDNPPMSRDSRAYGPVPLRSIEGRAFAVVYPRPHLLGRTFEHVESGPPLRLRPEKPDADRGEAPAAAAPADAVTAVPQANQRGGS